MAGRRAKLDSDWVGRPPERDARHRPSQPDRGGGQAPRVVWMPPVFDEMDSYARAVACRALDAAHATGRDPVRACAWLMEPAGWTPGRDQRVLETAEQVFLEHGVPLDAGPRIPSDRLLLGFAVAVGDRKPVRRTGRAGDRVVLTRALGGDVLFEAYLRRMRTPAQTRTWVRASTRTQPQVADWVRRTAAPPGLQVGPGGLAEALHQLADRSGLDVVVDASTLPSFPGATELLFAGCVPPGVDLNRRRVGRGLSVARGVPEAAARLILAPEWAGGIVLSAAPDEVEPELGPVVAELRQPRAARPVVRVLRTVFS